MISLTDIMMNSRKYKFALAGLIILLSLFWVSVESFHVESDMRFNEKCPVCIFQKSVSLFFAVTMALLTWISLFVVISKVPSESFSLVVDQFFFVPGQRAPPISY